MSLPKAAMSKVRPVQSPSMMPLIPQPCTNLPSPRHCLPQKTPLHQMYLHFSAPIYVGITLACSDVAHILPPKTLLTQ